MVCRSYFGTVTFGIAAKHVPGRFSSDTSRPFLAETFEIGDENPRVACIKGVPAIGTDTGSVCCGDFFLLYVLDVGDSPPRQQKCIFLREQLLCLGCSYVVRKSQQDGIKPL
jgi:hypothetical protein